MRILHFGNNPEDAERLKRFMEAHEARVDYVQAGDPDQYRRAVTAGPYDLILSNSNIPGISATTMLQLARKHCPETPFVFLSAQVSTADVLDGVRLGADDVVPSGNLRRLLRLMRHVPRRRTPQAQPD